MYRKRPLSVWAVLLAEAVAVPLQKGQGTLHGVAGDWLVQYGPGDFGVVAPAIFEQTYEVLS